MGLRKKNIRMAVGSPTLKKERKKRKKKGREAVIFNLVGGGICLLIGWLVGWLVGRGFCSGIWEVVLRLGVSCHSHSKRNAEFHIGAEG